MGAYYDYVTMEVKGVGGINYNSSAAYAYQARRMKWKFWKWEVVRYDKWVNEGIRRNAGEVYVSGLTKLAADGYVKLLSGE